MITVRCRSCHREERWQGEAREIVVEGGARRPPVAPELAAWRALLDSHAGRIGPIVAACAACGQPMAADKEAVAAIEWVVETPEGPVAVRRHGLRGPSGPIDWNEANALVEKHFSEGLGLEHYLGPRALVQGGLLALMFAPVVLWVFAAGTVVVFLLNVGR